MQTLKEATQGQKLRALPPRFGKDRGPWKPAEFSLRKAEREYKDRMPVARFRWDETANATRGTELFARAHARRHNQLRDALLEYTADPAFVERAFRSEAWQFAEANDYARERAAEVEAAA
jgi:hypothetical protein